MHLGAVAAEVKVVRSGVRRVAEVLWGAWLIVCWRQRCNTDVEG